MKIRGVDHLIGFVKGALWGTLLRSSVTVAFVFCQQLISEHIYALAYLLAVPSGVIGFVVGGMAGATCIPKLGAILGATLSGLTCFVLVCVPTAVVTQAIPHSDSFGLFALSLIGGLIVMIVAGGVAGYLGATAGRRSALSQQIEP